VEGLPTSNGIAGSRNGTIYVASVVHGGVRVLEEQADNTLVLAETIPTGISSISQVNVTLLTHWFTEYTVDNLSVDKNGAVWLGGKDHASPKNTLFPYTPLNRFAHSVTVGGSSKGLQQHRCLCSRSNYDQHRYR
jgi:hypothetical protein